MGLGGHCAPFGAWALERDLFSELSIALASSTQDLLRRQLTLGDTRQVPCPANSLVFSTPRTVASRASAARSSSFGVAPR